MAITPVVPLPDSRAVVDTQGVIIDFDAAPVEVQVDSVVVWDDTTGFQNGWGGSYITDTGIWRLVCDPPAAFTIGNTYEVYAETGTENLTYSFLVGLEKVTTEADVSAPQVVKIDTYVWSARIHNNEDPAGLPPQFDGPGNVYLQVLDPRGGEVLVVPGTEVGVVWDEGRNKAIIYFIRNESIFYMEADPGDTPTTQSQLRSIEATVRPVMAGEGAHEHSEATFPPIKYPDTQNVSVVAAGEGYWAENSSPYDAAPPPQIISGTLDGPPVVIRIERPTVSLESELLKGYYIVKFVHHTPSVIGYIEMGYGDSFVEFHDSCLTPGAYYAVMPLYHRWTQRDTLGRATVRSPETRTESWGSKVQFGSLGGGGGGGGSSSLSQVLAISPAAGEGFWYHDEESFPPLKQPVASDVEFGCSGGEGFLFWADSSFDPIGT